MTETVYRDDPYARHCHAQVLAVDARGVLLDRTVFYPTGGGQPGDSGQLILADGRAVPIVTTTRDKDTGEHWHQPAPDTVPPPVGAQITAELDWMRRHRHMRLHTCLHLLCSLVPGAVTGGNIATDKARLDFDLPEAGVDKSALTERLNVLIAQDLPVTPGSVTEAELDANPELVRTMSVRPPRGAGQVRTIAIDTVDLQPCGGTHVRSTAEIGRVVVAKIEKKGRQNRRIVVTFDDPTPAGDTRP